MRDVLITLLVFGSLPFILRRPFIGILVWSWLSYMNPHKLTWGFAFNMPFAQIVAITLLVSMFINREKLKVPITGLTIIWMLFIVWMLITTLLAIYPEYAFLQLTKVLKIQVVTFITIMLLTSMQRINLLIWVICVSIGYFSGKGGLFTITSGGGSRVYGPPGGFIQENNSLALATLMVIPLIIYLYRVHRNERWLRLGLGTVAALSLVSVLGSQSRGALIGFAAVAVFFWLKSNRKFISGMAIVILGFILVNIMPDSWHNRMESISTYQEDASAMGRINAWKYSINVATDRVTGAGFESWSKETFAIWAPNPGDVHAAHSIYFSVLADHGWLGLFLFLSILLLTWRNLSRIIRDTKHKPERQDENFLARMLQVSMIAYMSGGAFLSLSYFDLPWHLVAISVVLCSGVASSQVGISGKVNGGARNVAIGQASVQGKTGADIERL